VAYELPKLPAPNTFDIYEKSAETMNWLRNNIKVGFKTARGPAWWANGAVTKAGDWTEIPDGSHFDGPVPIEAVLEVLDVRLVKGEVHVTYLDENGERQVVADPAVQPIVNAKTGKVFSYPKESYAIHPYLQTLHGFVQRIQYDERVAVGSVGLLKNGGVAFLQAVLPEHFEVAGYGYTPYLTAVTSADLSRRTQYALGFDGAVCDNTVNAAFLGALASFGFKHSRNSLPSVQQAREGLGLQLSQAGETIANGIENLVKIDVSGKEFDAWLDATDSLFDEKGEKKTGRSLTMVTNRRDEKIRLWTKDEKVAPWAGTAFGILQLDNTYRTWNQTVKNVDGGRIERNYSNNAFGITAKADAEALQILADVKGKTLTFA
jgi:phage/plasmid-like protein (TIGR03299 family)